MTLKLNIYTTKLCREIKRTATAKDFELSLGVCEDVLDIINIDMFEGGLDSLSNEALLDLAVPIVKNAFPFLRELLAEIFEASDEEIRCTRMVEIAQVIAAIVKYSISQLKTLGGKKAKN